eukprot:scaffold2193_cov171-Amphora_coffeaeformis.AAC.14
MQEYYEDYNKEKKDVFGAVHFALFYTALLNAFQSMILAFAVGRVSKKMWVQTEALELNHYVEIREEFDRVTAELGRLQHTGHKSDNSSTSGTDDGRDPSSQWHSTPEDRGLRGLLRGLVDRIRYPRLRGRYNELLVQVRFHELRVHFLKAYNLPLKLKIADYLLRSEQHVLIKLVHVSSTAWLLLTASINLLYFVLGIVGTKTGDPGLVGTVLVYVFFCCMLIFIALAILLRKKVRSIFAEIMHRRELWEVQEDVEEKQRLAAQQMSLFWGSSPKLIIAAIQFMQFGYAVALATVIMFWEEIADGGVGMLWYWLAIAICYTLFVYVAAQVIPQYTLCTSLGQLVDKKKLSESVATFHLDEAKRQRKEEIVLRATMGDTLRIAPAPMMLSRRASDMSDKHSADGSTLLGTPSDTQMSDRSTISINDMVSMNTDSLRTSLPESERDALANRLLNRRDRRKRIKAVSDGVALMASLGKVNAATDGTTGRPGQFPVAKHPPPPRFLDDSEVSSKNDAESSERSAASEKIPQEPLTAEDTSRASLMERRRSRRGRMKTLSDGVSLMASLSNDGLAAAAPPRLGMVRENSERIADLVFADTKSLRKNLSGRELENLSERDSRRSTRQKSNSDGVGAMRDMETTGQDPYGRGRRRKAVSDGVKGMAAMVAPPVGTGLLFGRMRSPAVAIEGVSGALAEMEESERLRPGKNVDNASIRSLASDDDHSDFDDVPEADPNMMKLMTVEVQEHHETFLEKAHNYYLSKKYPVISNVFGTMIAFFIIGSRIERFLHTENIVSEEWISFDFGETITFWALTGWLSLFVVMDLGVFLSFGPYYSQHTLRARKVWVAAFLDLMLCTTCFMVFYMAEHNRCCYPSEDVEYSDSSASEGDGDESGYASDAYGYGSVKLLLPAPCACQAFGSRLYGGLGTIEPYTSLIALRLFRFWTASRIVKYLDKRRGAAITKEEVDQIAADNENLDPFDMADDHNDHSGVHGGHDDHGGHGHGHHEEKGTIAELWEAAVGNHPEIVAKYGEFSGELLQAMLGIPVIDTPGSTPSDMVVGGEETPDSYREMYLIEEQYSKLPSGAQEIIMAGKLGKAVVSVPDNVQHESTFTIPEDVHGEDAISPDDNPALRFEVAPEPIVQELDVSIFDAPNARLLRSMRRCERKLLPILDQWTVVDVVITRFEIVYFDAVGVDAACPNTSVFEALSATKGGKGLRLCDVAAGRRVVGHLSLSDITSINVEREMPDDSYTETDLPGEEVIRKSEYWKQKTDGITFSRREIWNKIKQDRLVAHTEHGHTLYLRFFSDLEDAQNHPEHYSADNEADGDLYKNNAFQWVQSISRMCGPEQLKQPLPHFGDDTNEELRDFLIVHTNEAEHKKGHRRGLSRGFGSMARMDSAAAVHQAEANRKGLSRRATSFGDSFAERPAGHRRFASQDMDSNNGGSSRLSSLFKRSLSHGPDPEEEASSPARPRSLPRSLSSGAEEDKKNPGRSNFAPRSRPSGVDEDKTKDTDTHDIV